VVCRKHKTLRCNLLESYWRLPFIVCTMIKSLKLKFGKAPGSPAEAIETTPVTVFVGPNNSGKSKVLSEINQFCICGTKIATNVIVDQINFDTW
jgi:AAA15 family ATPase/GTPase